MDLNIEQEWFLQKEGSTVICATRRAVQEKWETPMVSFVDGLALRKTDAAQTTSSWTRESFTYYVRQEGGGGY